MKQTNYNGSMRGTGEKQWVKRQVYIYSKIGITSNSPKLQTLFAHFINLPSPALPFSRPLFPPPSSLGNVGRQKKCVQALISRNLVRIRAMGNTSLETAEKKRGENVISTVLQQLIQALAIAGARAETEKATVDTARIDAEVSHTAC